MEGLDLKPILSAEEAPIVIHGTYFAAWDIIKRQVIVEHSFMCLVKHYIYNTDMSKV